MSYDVTFSTGSEDGYVGNSNSNWVSAREASTGNSDGSAVTRNAFGVRASKSAARGGGSTFYVTRSFFTFDTARYTEVPKKGTLSIYGYAQSAADMMLVKSTQGVTLTTADFNKLEYIRV
jgi:hypothetical protein